MNRKDFIKLIGAERDTEYLPVAFLLRSGYACAGHYNAALNEAFSDTCVILNAHLIELRESKGGSRPSIQDFSDFLEEIVFNFYETKDEDDVPIKSDTFGKSIPLTAIPYDEIAVIYPVSHIGSLMQRAEKEHKKVPTFLDFGKSEIVTLLGAKLW